MTWDERCTLRLGIVILAVTMLAFAPLLVTYSPIRAVLALHRPGLDIWLSRRAYRPGDDGALPAPALSAGRGVRHELPADGWRHRLSDRLPMDTPAAL